MAQGGPGWKRDITTTNDGGGVRPGLAEAVEATVCIARADFVVRLGDLARPLSGVLLERWLRWITPTDTPDTTAVLETLPCQASAASQQSVSNPASCRSGAACQRWAAIYRAALGTIDASAGGETTSPSLPRPPLQHPLDVEQLLYAGRALAATDTMPSPTHTSPAAGAPSQARRHLAVAPPSWVSSASGILVLVNRTPAHAVGVVAAAGGVGGSPTTAHALGNGEAGEVGAALPASHVLMDVVKTSVDALLEFLRPYASPACQWGSAHEIAAGRTPPLQALVALPALPTEEALMGPPVLWAIEATVRLAPQRTAHGDGPVAERFDVVLAGRLVAAPARSSMETDTTPVCLGRWVQGVLRWVEGRLSE